MSKRTVEYGPTGDPAGSDEPKEPAELTSLTAAADYVERMANAHPLLPGSLP